MLPMFPGARHMEDPILGERVRVACVDKDRVVQEILVADSAKLDDLRELHANIYVLAEGERCDRGWVRAEDDSGFVDVNEGTATDAGPEAETLVEP